MADHHKNQKRQSKNLPATTAKVATPAEPGVKGSATRTRWGACLKARPGAKLIMSSDIKALPHDTVIRSLKDHNPKKKMSADTFELYKFGNKIGAETTIAKYIASLGEPYKGRTHGGATQAYAHIAWDVNHAFVELIVAQVEPVPAEGETIDEVIENAPEGVGREVEEAA